MPKRRSGGGSGLFGKAFQTVICAVVISGIMVGLWNALPSSEGTLYEQAQVKSEALERWYQTGDWSSIKIPEGKEINIPEGERIDLPEMERIEFEAGKYEPLIPKSEVDSILSKLTPGEPQRVPYDREEWDHWITAPGAKSCWNVREQVLYEEAVKDSVKLLDKNDKEVKNVKDACKISKGEWKDPYTGKTFTNPSDLDIDHMIPLAYTARQGGQAWDADKKKDYANNMGNPNHLIAVEASANRQKGDQGPSTWKPSDKGYHCSYATSWTVISSEWGLTVPEADRKAIQDMLSTCS